MYNKSSLMVVGLLGMVMFALSACSGNPQNEPAGPSAFSGQASEVIVTRIVEVEVTRFTEVPVEITRIVRDVRVVTPTPVPTETPRAPERGNYQNPHPVGSTILLSRDDVEFEFTVREVIRGEEAVARVLSVDEANSEPPPGTEYVLARIEVEYVGEDAGTFIFPARRLRVVANNRIYSLDYFADVPTGLEPPFAFELLPGGSGEGWLAWAMPPDPQMMLEVDDVFFALYESGEESNGLENASGVGIEENREVSGPEFEALIGTWAGELDGTSVEVGFAQDGSYYMITIAESALPDTAPTVTREEGTWEAQEGNTVCLTNAQAERNCSEWSIVDRTLRLGEMDNLTAYSATE